MTTRLSGPMLPPRDGGAAKQAVVLLHGYGSDGRDLIGLGSYWRDLLPDALFVAPNAPYPCDVVAGGYQWFPLDVERPDYRLDGAVAVRPVIVKFLDDLWAQTRLGPGNTILGGFSQGAMMALHVGTTMERPLMGVLAFSGALIASPNFGEDRFAKPPVCLVHGDADPVVPPALSAQADVLLRSKGFPVSYHVSRGAGHTIAPDGLEFASQFIAKVSATV